jgi:hypothetical protein
MSTLAVTAGRNARAMRLDAEVNLQDFARAMRRHGLKWSTGRVGDFESGRAAANLATLYVVALALRDVTGHDVTLADLFGGDEAEQVQINDELSVPLAELRAALSGEAVSVRANIRTRLTGVVTPNWAGISPKLHLRVLFDFVETDERVCKRLGVTPDVGAAAMAMLWRRTFTAERDRRAGSDANPQHRGQVARQLQMKLQETINRGDDKQVPNR